MVETNARHDFVTTAHRPLGIAVSRDKVYYSDGDFETITEVNQDGQEPRLLKRNLRGVAKLMSFTTRHTNG